ncbi:hypothetical protein ECZU28_19580 [Escherichia coli]|nr:hypothetical protein ECZU28_19580 [Escherichia coli]
MDIQRVHQRHLHPGDIVHATEHQHRAWRNMTDSRWLSPPSGAPRHLRHQQLCGVAPAVFFLFRGAGPGFAHKTGFDQRPVKP